VYPDRVRLPTLNCTLEVFLLKLELDKVHVPAADVVQVVAPEPADHVPATMTPWTGPAAVVTAMVTVADQVDLLALEAPLSAPTHIGVGGGGAQA
jgi:hypothetical protein